MISIASPYLTNGTDMITKKRTHDDPVDSNWMALVDFRRLIVPLTEDAEIVPPSSTVQWQAMSICRDPSISPVARAVDFNDGMTLLLIRVLKIIILVIVLKLS